MHFLTRARERIELTPLATSVVVDPTSHRLAVTTEPTDASLFNAADLVTRASQGLFEMAQPIGKKTLEPKPLEGPPPTAFRESTTGLLRVVYREIVVRFKPNTPAKTRRTIL